MIFIDCGNFLIGFFYNLCQIGNLFLNDTKSIFINQIVTKSL
jgi:hypothetical protein